ncbi:MAG: hypothetical protein LUG27_08870 [Clostridiales bacterium]|nr:hypothetical protein [Clostridiales bacterium]
MRKSKKLVAILLCAAFILGMAAPVYASGTGEESSVKEENVYVTLASDGSVKGIYVVNSFSGGTITDYGEYDSVKILNTTDPISQDGDTITFSSSADKIYYQGELSDAEIPWDISIRYYMDGSEYPADEIAGKSGELEIRFTVSENTSCSGSFYEDYALQVSFSLDTELCSNITAADATAANVGSEKQLSYIILPGTGIETTICADVTDFEMDAVSISGIRMNLDIDIDDEELMDQITELTDAIEQIDDGTGELEDGAGELQSGGRAVSSGAQALSLGSDSLDSGVQALNSGIAEIQAGIDALNGQSDTLTGGSAQMLSALEQLQAALGGVSASASEVQAIVDASSSVQEAIDDLAEGAAELKANISYETYKAVMAQNGLDIDSLLSGNAEAIEAINSALAQVEQYSAALSTLGISSGTVDQYVSLANQILILLNGNTAAVQGMESYLENAGEGVTALAAGAQSLQENYAQFDAAIDSLADTLTGLLCQMAELKEAVNTLVEEYAKLDDGLEAYAEGVAQVAAGYSRISGGASELAGGSSELAEGGDSLYSGTLDLLDGLTQLYAATGDLSDGTGELREETSGMDSELEEKIDEILDSLSGGDGEPVSFVSDKNTNVASVQFAMQTESIEVEEVEMEEETEAELTMWQKLLRLFDLY